MEAFPFRVPPARYPCLRYHPSLGDMAQIDRGWIEGHHGPAILATIQGPDGRFLEVHRTRFNAACPKGKPEILRPTSGERLKVKTSLGSVKGGAIRLIPAAPDPIMARGSRPR